MEKNRQIKKMYQEIIDCINQCFVEEFQKIGSNSIIFEERFNFITHSIIGLNFDEKTKKVFVVEVYDKMSGTGEATYSLIETFDVRILRVMVRRFEEGKYHIAKK